MSVAVEERGDGFWFVLRHEEHIGLSDEALLCARLLAALTERTVLDIVAEHLFSYGDLKPAELQDLSECYHDDDVMRMMFISHIFAELFLDGDPYRCDDGQQWWLHDETRTLDELEQHLLADAFSGVMLADSWQPVHPTRYTKHATSLMVALRAGDAAGAREQAGALRGLEYVNEGGRSWRETLSRATGDK